VLDRRGVIAFRLVHPADPLGPFDEALQLETVPRLVRHDERPGGYELVRDRPDDDVGVVVGRACVSSPNPIPYPAATNIIIDSCPGTYSAMIDGGSPLP
jgi:hypothetical protein